MEGRIENGNVIGVWKGAPCPADSLQIWRIVERREVGQRLDVCLDGSVDDDRVTIELTTVYHTMSHRCDGLVSLALQRLFDVHKRSRMVGDLGPLAHAPDRNYRIPIANAIDTAF